VDGFDKDQRAGKADDGGAASNSGHDVATSAASIDLSYAKINLINAAAS
jgi:hypothetical protein